MDAQCAPSLATLPTCAQRPHMPLAALCESIVSAATSPLVHTSECDFREGVGAPEAAAERQLLESRPITRELKSLTRLTHSLSWSAADRQKPPAEHLVLVLALRRFRDRFRNDDMMMSHQKW